MTPPAPSPLRRVYWETTAACNLRCIHCRRTDVLDKGASDELTTAEARSLVDSLAAIGKPVLVFSGGEPLTRPDLLDVAAYARDHGLSIGLATNGTLVDTGLARRIRAAGFTFASVSLDGAVAATHDTFRGAGHFQEALRGFECLRDAGLRTQINLTVTRQNVRELPAMAELACTLQASALFLFLLVPVGCGVEIAPTQTLNASDVEEWLTWVCKRNETGPLRIKVICAPQVYRIETQRKGSRTPSVQGAMRQGCLAGIHMAFVSHKGEVFPCGYLPMAVGSLRQKPFGQIWNEAPLFGRMRDVRLLKGRCGACTYGDLCGGCRARGYFAYGDVLAEDPCCTYEPERAPECV